jgi:hypothetical protein
MKQVMFLTLILEVAGNLLCTVDVCINYFYQYFFEFYKFEREFIEPLNGFFRKSA